MTTSTNYITVRRAAELAGVSHWAIRKWIKRGRLRVKQPGGNRGYLLIDKSSLINILEGNNDQIRRFTTALANAGPGGKTLASVAKHYL
jgi:excisionase family DNA binding protein